MYGEDGRLIRSVTTREPEWDEQERAWAVALSQFEDELCPLCGRHLSVCTDPASEGRWHVPPPTRCFPTTAADRARKPYDERPDSHSRALLFAAELT